MIPIFRSHFSYGKSILNIDSKDYYKINKSSPENIFSICVHHGLTDLYLADSSMGGFVQAYKISQKLGIKLHFGYQLICCDDVNDKSESSLRSESKVIVWLKNGSAYSDLCSFYTESNVRNFYYVARCDYRSLTQLSPDNFLITVPFYNSFIHKNLLLNGKCVPDWNGRSVGMHIENHSLPFDGILKSGVEKYLANAIHFRVDSHSVFYYKRDDILPYQARRCIHERTTLNEPRLDHFGSDEFGFDSFLEKI